MFDCYPAQGAPWVSDVHAAQRAGTSLVDVRYDVTAGAAHVSMSVAISTNAGVTYDLDVSHVSGDVGQNITPGSNRLITWDAGADWAGRFSTAVRFKVTADDSGSGIDGFVLIPAGSFWMGNSMDPSEGVADELPRHKVYLSAFYIHVTEVSKSQWDVVYEWALLHGYGFDNAGLGIGADHPIQAVNWYDAVKWCNAWSEKEGLVPCYYTTSAKTSVYRTGALDLSNESVNWSANGYRLPTEAEWEKAARGWMSGQRFPWGASISQGQANYFSDGACPYDVNPTPGGHPLFAVDGYPNTSPVGYFAPNGCGLYDMAGNVWEWCWDNYSYYYYDTYPSSDPRGPTQGAGRALRGGSCSFGAFSARCAYRETQNPNQGAGEYDRCGFRPVRSHP